MVSNLDIAIEISLKVHDTQSVYAEGYVALFVKNWNIFLHSTNSDSDVHSNKTIFLLGL